MEVPMKMSFVIPTRNVVVTDRQASLVDRLIRSGRYQNASEVLREGLLLLERRESMQAGELLGHQATLTDEIEAQV